MRKWKHKLPPSRIHDYTIKLQTWLLLSSRQQEHQRLEQSLPEQIHSEKNNDDDDEEDNDRTLTRTCAGTVTSTRPRTRMTLSIIIIIVITTWDIRELEIPRHKCYVGRQNNVEKNILEKIRCRN